MSTASIRTEAYQSIGKITLPEILEPEDTPTLIADLEHLIGLLDNFRYMRDHKVVRRMMFEIAHLAMYGMKKFGVAWRDKDDGPKKVFFSLPDGLLEKDMWLMTTMAVDGERAYQDDLGPDRCAGRGGGNTIDKNPLSVGASFVMLEHYVVDARRDWTMKPGDVAAMHPIRKIAAIAIRDLETNGLPAYTDHAIEEPKKDA